MIIGLTGGIGCGKSTAAKIFKESGFQALDSDALVHQLLSNDPEIIAAIKDQFGQDVFSEGQINRQALASRVFSNENDLLWLENLLHPPVIALWDQAIAQAPEADWIIEIPVLFEKKLEKHVHYTVCLSSSYQLQLSRWAKLGISPQEAKARLDCQMPLREKEKRADFIITNNSTIDILREQITSLVNQLRNAWAFSR